MSGVVVLVVSFLGELLCLTRDLPSARNDGGTLSNVEQLVVGLFQRPRCWLRWATRCICGRYGIDSASSGAPTIPTHRVDWLRRAPIWASSEPGSNNPTHDLLAQRSLGVCARGW